MLPCSRLSPGTLARRSAPSTRSASVKWSMCCTSSRRSRSAASLAEERAGADSQTAEDSRPGPQTMERARRTGMSTDETIIEGVGNVFDDLGMTDAAAELVKAQLTFQLAKRIKALGLTQTAAAARLGISQPDVSRLMKRRPTGFSTDRLLALLTALDIDVDIVLRPASAAAHTAKVSIREELP